MAGGKRKTTTTTSSSSPKKKAKSKKSSSGNTMRRSKQSSGASRSYSSGVSEPADEPCLSCGGRGGRRAWRRCRLFCGRDARRCGDIDGLFPSNLGRGWYLEFGPLCSQGNPPTDASQFLSFVVHVHVLAALSSLTTELNSFPLPTNAAEIAGRGCHRPNVRGHCRRG